MSKTRDERVLMQQKGGIQTVGFGSPSIDELSEGVPSYRITDEGLVMFVKAKNEIYKSLFTIQSSGKNAIINADTSGNAATATNARTYLTIASGIALTANGYLPIGEVNPTIGLWDETGFVMTRSGSITGMSICLTVSGASGAIDAWSAQVRKNGSEVSNFTHALTTTTNGSKEGVVIKNKNIDRFVSGDVLNIYMHYSTDGGSTTIDDIVANIEVVFDN